MSQTASDGFEFVAPWASAQGSRPRDSCIFKPHPNRRESVMPRGALRAIV